MTIFYVGQVIVLDDRVGQVIVLDDFPAEKDMEIMMLAGKGTSPKTQTFPPVPDWIPKPTEPSNLVTSTHMKIEKESVQLQAIVSGLPIVRKASSPDFWRITTITSYKYEFDFIFEYEQNHGNIAIPN